MENLLNELFTTLMMQAANNQGQGIGQVAPPASASAIRELDDVDLQTKPFPKLKNDTCPICAGWYLHICLKDIDFVFAAVLLEEFKESDVYAKRMPCGCVVCHDEKNDSQTKRETTKPLRHVFHEASCLLPWLKKTNTCPMCRVPIDTLDADYEVSERRSSIFVVSIVQHRHEGDEKIATTSEMIEVI